MISLANIVQLTLLTTILTLFPHVISYLARSFYDAQFLM